MPPTNDITADYHSAGAKSDGPVEPIKVARVHGSGRLPTTDLQALLHKRLRFFSGFAAAGMAIAVLLLLFSPGIPWSAVGVYGLVLFVSAALAGVLWKEPSLNLQQLRVIELVFFGTVFALWSLVQAVLYRYCRVNAPELWFPVIMAQAIALPWVFIILLYGIFIPNTWRRCAAVVGVAAVVPLVISAAAGIADDATRGHGQELFWVPLGMWMASAAAVAIYGSHRIEVLRVEVSNTRKLGQYHLTRRLGSGGMGEVYLAEHVLLRRPCAVKLIRPDWSSDSKSLLRFEREVQATATLTHPNTVQIFDYGHAEDGTFYYAMEYLPGLNLEELVVRHGPLSPDRTVHLLRQVLGALHEAHATGLTHRDIKPSNIITCERGSLHDVAKLLDFGLVHSKGPGEGVGNLTQEGAVTGTPAYMSPEQADGKRDLGALSDIYSLGAVAYYLLTGQPPFVRSTLLQTLVAHARDTPMALSQLRAEVPLDLEGVVLRCLEKDPARRFPDARALEIALAGCHAAGLWTEERAAAWWLSQAGSIDGVSSVAEVAPIAAQPG
jgi:serine/threonine-protein kinase